MASVNGTSSSSMASMLGITGKGIGGLATGLNTDDLVSALTSGTQSKIAKQGQQKQLLNWKMTAYRTMTTALNAFQTKFLKNSSSSSSSSAITNIMRNDFFNTYKATSSSSKVSVSATSSASTGNFTIDKVQQLAEAESYTSVRKLSTTLSTGVNADTTFSGNFTGQTLKLEVDGFSLKTIKLDDLNQYLDRNDDGTYSIRNFEDFQAGLQNLLNRTYGTKTVYETVRNEDGTSRQVSSEVGVVKVSLDGPDGLSGNIMLDSDSTRIIVNTKNDLLGLSGGDSNRVDTNSNTSPKIGSIEAFNNLQGDVFTFSINGVEISVSKDDTLSTLMSKVTNSNAGVRMEYDKFNDVFKLTSKTTGAGSNIDVRDVHGNLMSELFGVQGGGGIGTGLLTTGDSVTFDINTIDSMLPADKRALAGNLSRMSFNLTINGVSKTVKLDTTAIGSEKLSNGTFTSEDIYKAINKGIQNSFYGSGVEFSKGGDGKTVISTSKGEAFSIKASGDFAKISGLSSTGSEVSGGNAITDFGYDRYIGTQEAYISPASLGLTASSPTASFDMTINGVTKTITVSLDERDPTDEERAAPDFDPDMKYYSEINGEVFVARLNQSVKAAFGADAVSFNASYEYEYEKIQDNEGLEETTFTFDTDAWENLDDEARRAGMDVLFDGSTSVGKIIGELEEGVYILEYEGEDSLPTRTLIDREGNLLNSSGSKIPKSVTGIKLTLDTGDTSRAPTKSVSMSGAFVQKLGFEGTSVSNANSSEGIKLSELKGGGNIGSGTVTIYTERGAAATAYTVAYTESMTLNDFLTKLNEELGDAGVAGIKDGKLYIESTSGYVNITDNFNPGSDPDNPKTGMLEGIFGISGGSFATSEASENQIHTAGKNAEIVINGNVIPSSSNTITYNGVNITINEVSDEAIKIGVQSDPEDVISRLKEWMADYNALVYTLNSAINEGKNSDYAPLTDAQKAEMTEDQIKTWETEAKKGILRNDQTLRGILADMRSVFTQRVEAAGISLYEIGIVTKSGLSDPNEAGQLEFDTIISGGGEERLRQMLTNDPDKVRLLFTDPENGIGAKLNTIITNAASTSSVNRGTLVRIAGTEQLTGDNTSQLGNKIKEIDKYVAALKSRLETEYSRYWKKFSSLEVSINKMNMQSSWLQSQ